MAKKSSQSLSDQLLKTAVDLYQAADADALLLVVEEIPNFDNLKKAINKKTRVLIAVESADDCQICKDAEFDAIVINLPDASVYDRLTQTLLTAVANEQLEPAAEVIALYSGFEEGEVDSISYISLDEHLGRLTARDLRQLETNVPLETLKIVVDLAVEIGREGREGKPVGTLFVVGDSRKVMAKSQPLAFDPVKGYSRKERNLRDNRVKEAIKEIALLDGAFIVASDGTVEAACRHLNGTTEMVTLSKGLGTRHWAAAGITKETKSIAIAVSESNGTVRIFQNGEVMLRIEPFRRPMKWKDFEYEQPAAEKE
ncbi:MAG: DNA integrity scanning protein DisA nucleotide-binding domain protein [Pirellulaceae bacterium]